jgi:hypothetical protein
VCWRSPGQGPRRETNEQVKARIGHVKVDIAAHEDAANEQAGQAAALPSS